MTKKFTPRSNALLHAIAHLDGWQNILSGLGVIGKDASQSTKFEARKEGIATQLHQLYSEDGLFARIIDAKPEHSLRKWIRLTGFKANGEVDDDWGLAVLQKADALGIKDALREMQVLDSLDGVGYIVMGTEDGSSIDQPMNLAAVKRVRYIQARSKRDITVDTWDDDPDSDRFGEPTFYRFHGGQKKIHHSRVVRMIGIRPPGLLRNSKIDCGISYANRVYEACRSYGETHGYLRGMCKDLSVGVVTLKGIAGLMASQKGNDTIIKRIQMMILTSSLFNFIPIDENEKFERSNISLAGVADIVNHVSEFLSATTGIPISILFGQAPAGLSTDDKGGRTTFYDGIRNHQETKLESQVRRILDVIIASGVESDGGQKFNAGDIARYKITWLPLEEETDAEASARRKTDAEVDAIYLEHDVITQENVFNRLANDPNSQYELDEFDGVQLEETDPAEDGDTVETRDAQDPNSGGDPGAIDDPSKPGVAKNVQQSIPNGTQLAQVWSSIKDVAAGMASRQSGQEFLAQFFGISTENAVKLLGPEDFKPSVTTTDPGVDDDDDDSGSEEGESGDRQTEPGKKTPPKR